MRWPVRLLLLAPGPLRYPFIREGLDFYAQRLRPYLHFETLFPKASGGPEKEGRILKRHLSPGDYLVALTERGKLFSTREFASWLENLLPSRRRITVLAGGPEGLCPELLSASHFQLSLSPLTFHHELALLVFAETLYRALTLLSGHPYHRD
ncbi:23S rRNA (pseudouridine(1915)-N(3))-methyltransferase RlmH [Thermosulfurimonas sp.]|uniref:23S rRNA (pseudouridine(1915)-N(3))-methyltransferase RlmH n=1 Tax=Thermosulfurimonas sp. TaxID=2080236 RepID=UPI0025F3E08E|nr:23S rRNA (pseudouridine(1915)-N(3))-methyltransferase RlmH [Thermosulfurimonas sp.]